MPRTHKPILVSRYQRRRARRRARRATLVLFGAAALGILVGGGPRLLSFSSANAAGALLTDCRAVDGDTLRCEGERIRLLGIDAPELPGCCCPGRACAPGDPLASTRSLEHSLVPPLRVARLGVDAYGRTLALVSTPAGNLSCYQLARGQARYRPDWDNSLHIARACPMVVAGWRR